MAATETRDWLTPNEIARERRISVNKVISWIRSGELAAINMATRANSERPRWRVTRDALAAFDRGRMPIAPPAPARKRRPSVDVPRYV